MGAFPVLKSLFIYREPKCQITTDLFGNWAKNINTNPNKIEFYIYN